MLFEIYLGLLGGVCELIVVAIELGMSYLAYVLPTEVILTLPQWTSTQLMYKWVCSKVHPNNVPANNVSKARMSRSNCEVAPSVFVSLNSLHVV